MTVYKITDYGGMCMALKARIFNVMQYERHPETGEVLLTEDKIKDAVAHRTVTRWAYVCHDEDVYSALDEEQNPDHIKGQKKPRHWHVVMEFKNNAVEIGVVARWLGIPDNFVNVAKGAGAFLDCVQYLTHEDDKQQGLGKRLYDDSRVQANFDFRYELDARAERKARYGKDLPEKDRIRNEVLYHGKTLREVVAENPLAYQDDFKYLESCRLRYISKMAKMPKARINYYVEGLGGMGKGLISKAIARALVDRTGTMNDDDIYFEVGSDKASFEGYDGQPVIIWNDCRAYTLLQKLGGRENVFNVFDPFPPNIAQNIKYGSVRLNNAINIVNSVQPYKEFLDGLAGEDTDKNGETQHAEDKGQSYRRFPFFLVLHEEDYDFGMNRGVFDGTREYEQYMILQGLRGSMRKIVDRAGNNYVLRDMVSGKVLTPVVEKHRELEQRLGHQQQGTDEEILAEFADYGTQDPSKVTNGNYWHPKGDEDK